MLSLTQANQINTCIRECEDEIRRLTGLQLRLGVYGKNKSVTSVVAVDAAINTMANALGYTTDDVLSKARKPESLLLTRIAITAVLRECFCLSLQDVAKSLNRTHTSIIDRMNEATDLMNSGDVKFIEILQAAKESINA